jgi:hypothetical protein
MKFFELCTYLVLTTALTGCDGCSKSAQKSRGIDNRNSKTERRVRQTKGTIVKMEKRNGVYYIPVELNGSKMDFIFSLASFKLLLSQVIGFNFLNSGG